MLAGFAVMVVGMILAGGKPSDAALGVTVTIGGLGLVVAGRK